MKLTHNEMKEALEHNGSDSKLLAHVSLNMKDDQKGSFRALNVSVIQRWTVTRWIYLITV